MPRECPVNVLKLTRMCRHDRGTEDVGLCHGISMHISIESAGLAFVTVYDTIRVPLIVTGFVCPLPLPFFVLSPRQCTDSAILVRLRRVLF